jgi:peptidoglycan/xylan/chitin deacetylase (PgdA/CDA1 family)
MSYELIELMLSINSINSASIVRHICSKKIKTLLGIFYEATGLSSTLRKGKATILMYHRVMDGPPCQVFTQPGMYVTKSTFEMHLIYLKQHFEIVSLTDILTHQQNFNRYGHRPLCAITFDDGWRDNYTNAFPLLKKYEIPATIFLPTSYVGTANWFWPERLSLLLTSNSVRNLSEGEKKELFEAFNDHGIDCGYKNLWWLGKSLASHSTLLNGIIESLKARREPELEFLIARLRGILKIDYPQERLLLNWEEIEEMSKHGISFGSHTCNHVILTKWSREEINYQIRESRAKLMKHRINFIPILAYPNGNYNELVVEETKKAGYEAAVTTEFGFNDENTNPYELSRISIHNDIASTVPMFAYHISGIFHKLSKANLNKLDKFNLP